MTDKTLGAYERHESPDYMDGGVTAAQVEKEALSGASLAAHFRDKRDMERARAEKAEAERDEALYQRDQWMRANDSTRDILDEAIEERRRIARALDLPENATADAMVKHAAESRPLTPDAITDEMVKRGEEAYRKTGRYLSFRSVHLILTAALTEPPARPEGAEEIEALVEESLSGDYLSDAQVQDLADFLAGRGVRVVGGERS